VARERTQGDIENFSIIKSAVFVNLALGANNEADEAGNR